MEYIANYNFIRVLGIRPRGCDAILQTVVDGTNKIVGTNSFTTTRKNNINFFTFVSINGQFFFSDVANPLIGDIVEYERFVYVHTEKHVRKPADHGECLELLPYRNM